MKLKLFVDDWRKPPIGWHLAKTITEAIRILSGPSDIEAVSLDHDIRKEVMHLSDSYDNTQNAFSVETFASVAHYIAIMPKEKLPKIVYFHTSNPIGAEDMAKILEGIVPTYNTGNDTVYNTTDINYKDILNELEKKREGKEEPPEIGEFYYPHE